MRTLLLILALLLTATGTTVAQYAIIANPSVEEYSIDKQDVLKIYTVATTQWKNGSPVVAFDLKDEGKTRNAFYDYINRTPLEMRRGWMKMVSSKTGKAPEAIATEEELVEKVASTPGAIGYVASAKVGKKVKVLARF